MGVGRPASTGPQVSVSFPGPWRVREQPASECQPAQAGGDQHRLKCGAGDPNDDLHTMCSLCCQSSIPWPF